MPLVPLTNDRWSYESNCFVCEQTNTGGLKVPFFHDVDNATVVATFALDQRYSGAPSFVHGGMVLAIADEAMAWATIALGHKFALTAETTTRFTFPVLIEKPHTVTARLDRVGDDGMLYTSASIVAESGEACATSTAIFHPMSEAQTTVAAGQDVVVTAEERALFRDDDGRSL